MKQRHVCSQDVSQRWGVSAECCLPSCDSILQALREARKLAPGLEEVLDLYEKIFRIQCRYRDSFQPPHAGPSSATSSPAASGKPRVPRLPRPLPGLTADLLRAILADLGGVFRETRPDHQDCAAAVLRAAGDDEGGLLGLLDATLARDASLARRAASLQLSPPVLSSLLGLAASPLYEASAAACLQGDGAGGSTSSCCPCCGQPPAIAVIRRDGAGRWFECVLCRTSWRVARLYCPFCGNSDAADLGSLVSAELAFHSVDLCERCHRFLKTVNSTDLVRDVCPRVEQVLMLPLDVAAVEKGFRP